MPDHPTHFAPSIEVYSPLQSSWVQKGCLTAEPGRTYTPATYVNCHYIKLKWTSFLSWNCRPATKDPQPSLSFHRQACSSGAPCPSPIPAAAFIQPRLRVKRRTPSYCPREPVPVPSLHSSRPVGNCWCLSAGKQGLPRKQPSLISHQTTQE